MKVPDPSQVVEAGYYAVKHDPSAQYRRVKLVRKMGPKIQVSHVDYGELDIIDLEELRVLPQEFAALPAQAIKARLSGNSLF